MNPPRWFWHLLAACVAFLTVVVAWRLVAGYFEDRYQFDHAKEIDRPSR